MDDTLKETVIRGGAAALAVLLLQSCVQMTGANEKQAAENEDVAEDLIEEQSDDTMPEGAIFVREHLYVVPVAVDAEGCEQFREWSDLGVTRLVIYFRDGKGSFTPIKSEEGSCNAQMAETGPDEDGCPAYRAEQPDGSVTEIPYYEFPGGGYTINKERSVCAS